MARDIDERDSIVCRKLKKIDWSVQEKIKQANRSVREIEQDMYEVAKLRRLPGEKGEAKKDYVIDERADAARFLVIFFIISAVICGLLFLKTDSPVISSLIFSGTLILMLSMSFWRGYIDLYFKALKIRNKVKREGREPVSLMETIKYLIRLFMDTETTERMTEVFTTFPDYKECREEAMNYPLNLDAAINGAEKKLPNPETQIATLNKRKQVAIKLLDDLEEKEKTAEKIWQEVYKNLHGAQAELIRIEEYREEHLNPEKLGSIDDLERDIAHQKEKVAEGVIADVEFLRKKVVSAQSACNAVLVEKARNKKDPAEDEPEKGKSSVGMEQG